MSNDFLLSAPTFIRLQMREKFLSNDYYSAAAHGYMQGWMMMSCGSLQISINYWRKREVLKPQSRGK